MLIISDLEVTGFARLEYFSLILFSIEEKTFFAN
jgi:hypothetical protein